MSFFGDGLANKYTNVVLINSQKGKAKALFFGLIKLHLLFTTQIKISYENLNNPRSYRQWPYGSS
jgi:hypothetical protein